MGAIKREMNNAKWTAFAIGYQCVFAYAIALVIYQIGLLVTGSVNVIGLIFAIAIIAFICYMLFKPYKESNTLKTQITALLMCCYFFYQNHKIFSKQY